MIEMEIAAMVLEYLKVMAWPVAVLILAGLFRTEVRDLVDRIQHVKGPGFEARITGKMSRTAAKAEEIPELIVDDEDTPRSQAETRHSSEMLLGRLLTAWSELEVVARETASERGHDDRRVNLRFVFEDLKKAGLVSSEVASVASNMQSVRNDIVHHAAQTILTPEFVGEFEDTSRRLASLLRKIQRESTQ